MYIVTSVFRFPSVRLLGMLLLVIFAVNSTSGRSIHILGRLAASNSSLMTTSNVDTIESHIIDGQPSGQCKWPWHVALSTDFSPFFCGATLITEEWLVTAAHCVDGIPFPMYAKLGAYNITADDQLQTIEISTMIIHNNYSGPDSHGDYDIALLKLSSPVVTDPNCVQTISYDSQPLPDNMMDNCSIIGWGATDATVRDEMSEVVTEREAEILPNDVCQIMWAGSFVATSIQLQNICINPVNHTSACYGDSGSPLMCFLPNTKDWQLVGFSAWGSAACRKYPSVYMRVSYFQEWMNEEIRANTNVTIQ